MQKRLPMRRKKRDSLRPGFLLRLLPSGGMQQALHVGRLWKPLCIALLMLLFQPAPVHSQDRRFEPVTINGTVRDQAGTFLSNISVTIQGTNRGTVTNMKGEFSLQATRYDTLAFSAVGYVPQLVPVNDNRVFYIVMETGDGTLNDVVVVGFGKQRRISVIGAQSTIKPEDLKLPVANINTLLAGRISGVVGVQRSGQPGRNSADIWIRGISTFGDNVSRPLVLVDGVERSIDNLDPQDIESFTILKDAAGTAVYGVRGANGVVLVTTKSGKLGKPKVSLDFSQGLVTFVKVPEMADAKTYMEAVNESLVTRGKSPRYSDEYMQKTLSGEDPLVYPNVDWFDALYRDWGQVRRANVNVNGGSEFLRYYGSIGYYEETGLLKTSSLENYNSDLKYRRFNVTTNVNMNITKTTKLDIGIRGFFSNNNLPAISTESIFGEAMVIAPTEFPLEFPDGRIPGKSSNGGFRNPWADLTRRGYRTEFDNSIYSNLRLTQDLSFLVKGLSINSMFAFDVNNEVNITRQKREPTYWFVDIDNPRNPDGSLNLRETFAGNGNFLSYERANDGNRRFYSQTAINYDNQFGDHRIGGMALFYTDDYMHLFAGNYENSIPDRYVGLATRVTYSYDDRYFVEGNLGFNGSGLFDPDRRYGTFPAIGLGWVVSNEKFFAPVKDVITYLKFRASYGSTGIGKINNRRFAFMDIVQGDRDGYRYRYNDYSEMRGINITDYGFAVGWSESVKQNVGVEIKSLNDRLSVIFDVFREDREGIFLRRSALPLYMGLNSQPHGNLGKVKNQGIDATLEYNGRIGNVDISVRGNVTYNKDILLENDQPEQPYPWMNERGHNILQRRGYIALGLFESQDEIDNSAVPGDRSMVAPGDIKYKDLNNDGEINAYDMTVIGRGDVPNLIFGFGFTVSYKRWNLGAMFTGQGGADIMLQGEAIHPFSNDLGLSNVFANITDRWQEGKPSQNVFYPRLANGQTDNFNNTRPSTWWVRNADFIRLKTLELSYRVPAEWYGNAFRSASVYFQAINPLTFTDFDLWDVESTINTGNGRRYPNVKSFSLGITLDF